jgi:hypothetical protein
VFGGKSDAPQARAGRPQRLPASPSGPGASPLRGAGAAGAAPMPLDPAAGPAAAPERQARQAEEHQQQHSRSPQRRLQEGAAAEQPPGSPTWAARRWSAAELLGQLRGFPVPPPEGAGGAAAAAAAAEQRPGALPDAVRERLLCRVLAAALRASGALPALLAAQRLDVMDIEGVAPLLERLLAEGPPVGGSGAAAAPPDGSHGQSSGSGFGGSGGGGSSGHPLRLDPEALAAAARLPVGDVPREAARQLLRAYLTAVTAKDCGVMVTLQQVAGDGASGSGCDACADGASNGSGGGGGRADCTCGGRGTVCCGGLLRDDASGCSFLWRVNLVDLDLKPLAKVGGGGRPRTLPPDTSRTEATERLQARDRPCPLPPAPCPTLRRDPPPQPLPHATPDPSPGAPARRAGRPDRAGRLRARRAARVRGGGACAVARGAARRRQGRRAGRVSRRPGCPCLFSPLLLRPCAERLRRVLLVTSCGCLYALPSSHSVLLRSLAPQPVSERPLLLGPRAASRSGMD